MESRTYNPFPNLGKQYADGLDYIINNLPTPLDDTTFEKLNDTLIKYLQSILDSSGDPEPTVPPIIDNIVYSILPNAANSYQNNNLKNESFYNEKQIALISSIIESVKNNSVDAISTVLSDADNKIAQSGLSSVDQSPLFVAVQVGKKSFDYWSNVIDSGTPSGWLTFLNTNAAVNTANLSFWVVASIEGALSGYSQIQQLDMSAANAINSLGRAVGGTSAMTAAVGLSAGKIIFKWAQKSTILSDESLLSKLRKELGDDVVGQLASARFRFSRWGGDVILFN